MDKLEYIPGDLGIYNGNIITIENSDGYYATYYDEEETLQEVNVNAIEGIPLTPKILEKNRWKNDDRGYYKSYIFLNKDDFGSWVVGIGEEYISTITFVHQLQHLLFGLGINHKMEV